MVGVVIGAITVTISYAVHDKNNWPLQQILKSTLEIGNRSQCVRYMSLSDTKRFFGLSVCATLTTTTEATIEVV